MKQTLTSVDLVNYRKFKKLHLDFPERLNVFIGPNGGGKTTAMKAIEKILNRELPTEEDNPIKESNAGRNYQTTKIVGTLSGRYDIVLTRSSDEVIATSTKKRVKRLTIPELVCISASRNRSIDSHATAVDSFVFTNKDTKTLVEMIQQYAIKRVRKIDPNSETSVNVRKLLESIQIETSPSSKIRGFSSGKISFEYIINRIGGLNDGVVIIEEPEVYLHPQHLNLLVGKLFEIYNSTKVKIFVSTHSPNVANYLVGNNADLFYFTNDKSKPVIKFNKKDFSFLNEYISNFSFSDFFFSKVIFVVEGRTEEIVIRSELYKRGYFDFSVIDMAGPSKDKMRECKKLFKKMQNLQVRFVFDKNESLGAVTDEGNIRNYCSHDSIEKTLCTNKKFINSAKKIFAVKTKKEVEDRMLQLHEGGAVNYHRQLKRVLSKIDKSLDLDFLKDLPT